jgi:hypothetical protein
MFVWYIADRGCCSGFYEGWPGQSCYPSDCEWMVPGTVDPNDD